MTNIRLPRAVCAVVAEVLDGSHETREALFEEAGVPGPPPDLPHHSKWKTWLQRAGDDTSVDSLAVIGRLIEEFMDLPPLPAPPSADVFGLGIGHDPVAEYNQKRTRLNTVLEEHGFRYFRGDAFSRMTRPSRIRRRSPVRRIRRLPPPALRNFCRGGLQQNLWVVSDSDS